MKVSNPIPIEDESRMQAKTVIDMIKGKRGKVLSRFTMLFWMATRVIELSDEIKRLKGNLKECE